MNSNDLIQCYIQSTRLCSADRLKKNEGCKGYIAIVPTDPTCVEYTFMKSWADAQALLHPVLTPPWVITNKGALTFMRTLRPEIFQPEFPRVGGGVYEVVGLLFGNVPVFNTELDALTSIENLQPTFIMGCGDGWVRVQVTVDE